MVVQLYNKYLTIWLYNWYGLCIKIHININTPFFSNTVFIEHDLLINERAYYAFYNNYGILQTRRIAFLPVVYNLFK